MKILWFANYRFREVADSNTGTWLGAMGRALVASGRCELFNITLGGGNRIAREDCGAIRQWLLPYWRIGSDGLPSAEHVNEIKAIVDSVHPDIVHVWGLESYYGLLIVRGIITGYHNLLDIQGIRFAVGEFFMGNLTAGEQKKCVSLKELLKPALSPFRIQQKYLQCRSQEVETLCGFRNISYQSEWSHRYLNMFCRNARLFKTRRMLRSEFLSRDSRWTLPNGRGTSRYVFSICAGSLPYKGAHVLIRALSVLKRDVKYADVKLLLGGGAGRKGMFRSGYLKFIESEIARLGVSRDVVFLGALTAAQMRDYFLQSSLFVHPSFIESYSLAVSEAMSMGVPSVISYAGAMSELAEDGESALYFPAGDSVLCAECMKRILDSDDLAVSMSEQAFARASKRNSPAEVISCQLSIYDAILGSEGTNA